MGPAATHGNAAPPRITATHAIATTHRAGIAHGGAAPHWIVAACGIATAHGTAATHIAAALIAAFHAIAAPMKPPQPTRLPQLPQSWLFFVWFKLHPSKSQHMRGPLHLMSLFTRRHVDSIKAATFPKSDLHGCNLPEILLAGNSPGHHVWANTWQVIDSVRTLARTPPCEFNHG